MLLISIASIHTSSAMGCHSLVQQERAYILCVCCAGLQQEGLFRKSGHIGRQRVLRDHIESSAEMGVEVVHAELHSALYSPHDVASLLKSFLGEMPEPLLTEKHYVAHFQVPGKYSLIGGPCEYSLLPVWPR